MLHTADLNPQTADGAHTEASQSPIFTYLGPSGRYDPD